MGGGKKKNADKEIKKEGCFKKNKTQKKMIYLSRAVFISFFQERGYIFFPFKNA